MITRSRYRLIRILVVVCYLILLPGCYFGFNGRKPLPTPVVLTPTPHYAPMTGMAFVNKEVSLHTVPDITSRAEFNLEPGTIVEILEAKWYYGQFRYGDDYCYMYRVRIPGTETEGWLEQDYVVPQAGGIVPIEQRCFPDGAIPTPSHTPLSGTVFVNVGDGYGAAGTIQRDPRLIIRYVLAHGTRVEIAESFWAHYAANQAFSEILCFVYQVQIPGSTFTLWLPEDVLSTTMKDNPRRHCFPYRIPPSLLQVSPALPDGYELVTPEPE